VSKRSKADAELREHIEADGARAVNRLLARLQVQRRVRPLGHGRGQGGGFQVVHAMDYDDATGKLRMPAVPGPRVSTLTRAVEEALA
jgi:hypothetical protein